MRTSLTASKAIYWPVIGAFAVIYVVWGSTYLANYFAIQSIPPFLMSGCRFTAAGLALYAFTMVRKKPAPTLRQWFNAGLIGILFLAFGTGGVVWAEQYIDTSMAALIVAFDPLLIMTLMWLFHKTKVGSRSWMGAGLGVIGMVLLVGQPQLTGSRMAVWGLLAIGISMTAWATASIYVSRVELPQSRMRSTAMQMITGGGVLLIFSAAVGEFGQFDWVQVTPKSAFSWVYLVFFGSLLGFSCFNYLLMRVSPEKVATSTYVNPVVALLLGWSLNGETITGQSLLAGAILLTGVFFINTSKGPV